MNRLCSLVEAHSWSGLGTKLSTGRLRSTTLALVLFASGQGLWAEVKLDKEGKAKVLGDFRLRFESDWDSQRSDGSRRDDRDRMRIRARLGFQFDPTPHWSMGFRLRSGSSASQQSPHITIVDFDDNPKMDKDAVFDKYYLRFSSQRFWAWGGRNSFPFWKQNELFWDDDATPAGLAVGLKNPWSKSEFALNAGLFALPDGAVGYSGQLGAIQGVLTTEAGKGRFVAAGGLFRFFGEPGAERLRNGNGRRDYTILVGNLQGRFTIKDRQITLGLDLLHNVQGYSLFEPDPFTAANRDQNDGLVASIAWGDLSRKGSWLGGYYYAYIETLAVNASFAQDDWVRWGAGGQTDSSDFKGHELRLAYALTRNANLVARLYLVESITSLQDGKRFRLDFNISF